MHRAMGRITQDDMGRGGLAVGLLYSFRTGYLVAIIT